MKKVLVFLIAVVCLSSIILSVYVCNILDYENRSENTVFSEIMGGVKEDRTTILKNSDTGESYYKELSIPSYKSLNFVEAIIFLLKADSYESFYFITLGKPLNSVNMTEFLVDCEIVFADDNIYLYCQYTGENGITTTVYKSDAPISYSKNDVEDCNILKNLIYNSVMSILMNSKNHIIPVAVICGVLIVIGFFVRKIRKNNSYKA